VPHSPEQQRAREGPAAEGPEHGSEARRAAIDGVGVDGQDHLGERDVQKVGHHGDEDHREDERAGPHES
jgi:hypothetical protein